jgi:hypothetical protein
MITTFVSSTDGRIFLRTQHGADAAEIAEALKPYIGHFAAFYPPNAYGHINVQRTTWGWIRAVQGESVTVHVPALGYTGDVNAFDAFGSYCTMIEPASKKESA